MLGKFSAVIELLMDQNADLNLEDGEGRFEGGTMVWSDGLWYPPPLSGLKKDTKKNTTILGGPLKRDTPIWASFLNAALSRCLSRAVSIIRWVHAHSALDHPFSTALLFVVCFGEWLI